MALTLTAKKMLTFGVLVNNLDTIETLGMRNKKRGGNRDLQ